MRKPRYTAAARDACALAAGLALYFPLAGCSSPKVADQTIDEPHTEITSAVSAATWTDGPWPFTIESGELRCIGSAEDPGVYILTETGEMFALNPAAIRAASELGAAADLNPIWRDHPNISGAKVNVSPMILYGLTLC